MGTIKEDLRRQVAEMAETHISWVFLTPSDVWKVKKPVSLGFLDFSTSELRRSACETEVRLNRRLAPEVYRGVVPITRDETGTYRFGGSGEPVDWAVHMQRLPDADRTDVRLSEGRLDAGGLRRIAERIAAFHAESPCNEDTARLGTIESIAANVRENFEQTRDRAAAYVEPGQAEEIERWQLGFLAAHERSFEQRIADGRVRDGHGDLRLEQIYLDDDGTVTILDCIEFDERFRYGDVCADVAFLSMDLAWHGRVDLAERFLAAYARTSNDFDLYALVDFYESYRAYVRAKVASILADDDDAERETRERAATHARRYFLLALASERRSLLPPTLVAVGGIIASGKSTVAERVADELAAPVVDADRTRKSMLGLDPTEKVEEGAWQGAYAPEFSRQVYGELLRRACVVLASGRPVVVDASFRSREMRAAARDLAAAQDVPFYFIECRADLELCRERLQRRSLDSAVSDARLEIFDDFVAGWDEVDELDRASHLVLDTSRPLDAGMQEVRRHVATWPEGLTQ